MMSDQKKRKKRKPQLRRKGVKQDVRDQVVAILFSSSEREMLDYFVKKYRLSSRSAYIRRLVMTDVLSHLFEDTPTLFDHKEPENENT